MTFLDLTSKFCNAKIETVCRNTYIYIYMSHVVNHDVMSHHMGLEGFTGIDIIQMAY